MKSTDWKPTVTLDLASATPKAFNDTYNAFYEKNAGRTTPMDLFTTGWNTVTPEKAELALFGQANRKLSVATIAYYARMMASGEWHRTGEPILIDTAGRMRDAYHRCWACYLSGHSFESFVVTGIDPQAETLLAIDNGKARSDVDGLQFSGLNGLSRIIASVVKIAVRHDAGYYEPHSRVRINKMSPQEVVAFVKAQPSLHDAAHEVIAEFKETLADHMPGKSDVACYVGWRIRDLHGVDVMEDFFTALGEEEPSGPVALLRAKLEAEVESLAKGYRAKLSKYETLAFMIKAFNAWQAGTSMRRLVLGTDEAFPQFAGPASEEVELPDGVVTPRVPGQGDPTDV